MNLTVEFSILYRYNHWTKASPWLGGTNPRDAIMPKNGDDGFFPTTGNDLVCYNIVPRCSDVYLGTIF